MPSKARIVLGAVLPAALLLGLLLPPFRPLDRVLLPVQTFFFGLFVYHLTLVILGTWKAPVLPMPLEPRTRFAVITAAHNEETVIGALIASVRAQHYPIDRVTIFVVADHCGDRTAEVARDAGAEVFERREGERRGKGVAVDWILQRIWERGADAYDAAVLVDADNLVAPDFLRQMDAHLRRGDQVVQGYLGTKNPDDSWVTRAIFASYAYTNRFFQLAKDHLGLGSALGGTGLCIAMPLLRDLGWRCTALTEDLEFQIRAILAGVRPTWGWQAVVYDEKPLTFMAAFRQRLRWMQGHASVAVRYLGPMFRRAITRRDIVAWDTFVYLSAPIWLTFALALAVLFAANQGASLFTYLYPVWVPPVMLAVTILYPFVALRLEGHPTAPYLRLTTFAAILLLGVSWPLLGFLGLVRYRARHWVKTVHTRSLTIQEVAVRREDPLAGAARWATLRSVRMTAGALAVFTIVAAVTPRLTAHLFAPGLEKGALLLLDGDVDHAVMYFETLLEEHPDDPGAHAYLGLAHRVRGNVAKAAASLRQAKRLDPELGDTVVALGDFFVRHRSHPNAPRLLHTMLGSVRSGPDAYAWTANKFIERRRLKQAQIIVEDGVQRYGERLPLLRSLGQVHFNRGGYAQAIEVWTTALRLAPSDVGLLINLGWSHVRLRQYARAVPFWERALRLDPRNTALRQDLERVRTLVL